jgi:hypothetical protein
MTKKFKHKKLKNTGLLYELLIRQMTSDVLQGKKPTSVSIIKKYFRKDSPLMEELKLYNSILEAKEKDSNFALQIVESAISSRKFIDDDKLQKDKYNLIKEINENFDRDIFLKTQVDNYKVYASLFNLFEYKDSENPNLYLKNKLYVANFIISERKEHSQEKSELLEGLDPEMKALTFKLLVEKFNNKFSSLNENQKAILRHFIFNSVDSLDTKKFIAEQVDYISESIKKSIANTKDTVLIIKLKEILNLLPEIKNVNFVTESQYLSLIRYHQLVEELK